MKWLLFAWKNVLRNRRRTVITVLLASLGTASVLLASGFALYTYDALRQLLAQQIGHVVLAHQNFFDGDEEMPLEHGLDAPQALADALRADPRVTAVLPRIEFSGLISNGEKSAIFLGTGVDAASEFRLNANAIRVEQGRLLANPAAPDRDPEVMIGKDLARNLKVEVGGSLTLLATTAQGVLNARDVQVVGIYSTGTPEMDARAITTDLATAQELLVSQRVSTLAVYLHDLEGAPAFKGEWQQRHPTLALRTWDELAAYYTKVRALYDRIFGVLGIIIVVMVFFAVTNTMSMAVAERTREIGTLAALGTSPGRIVANFALEAGIIGFISALVGMAIAGAITALLHLFPVMMPAPPGRTEGYPLYIYFDAAVYVAVSAIIFAAAVAAALIAARRGANRPIVEALQHV